MSKHLLSFAAIGILMLGRSGFGLATEQIGPDTDHPTVAQPDWPLGIAAIPRHQSRVYSVWVNGNETFYFKCKVDEINELIAIFARASMRDHVVQIRAGHDTVSSFDKQEIAYNLRLQIVAGFALSFARKETREDLPLEPTLTIYTGDDNGARARRLQWPKHVIVASEIPGLDVEE